jgi:5-methylcytosine-specific restriction endonuclease McrA
MGKELFESGMKCAEIAQIIGYSRATVEGSVKAWGWERKVLACFKCGTAVPPGKSKTQARARVCESCETARYRKKASDRIARMGAEGVRAAKRGYCERMHQRGEVRSMESIRAERDSRESNRRQRPLVQLGRFRHYGEQPTTREGALSVLQSTLSMMLDLRCTEQGVSRDTIEYNSRYKHDDIFRARQKAKAVRNRARREQMPDDGTLTSGAIRSLFAAAKCCAYCDKPINGKDKTLDHMHPVSLGGLHSIHNAVICCYSCNSRKRDQLFDHWLTRIPPHIAARFRTVERAA